MNEITFFQPSQGKIKTQTVDDSLEPVIASARTAQRNWATQPLGRRLEFVRRARFVIAEEALRLGAAANHTRQRSLAEVLTAEVLPLADACRFLERESAQILKPRRIGSHRRPLWLHGVTSEILREPHGLVMIISPG